VHVSAKDLGTGHEQKVTITASTNLNEDEIKRAVNEAERFADEDKKRKEEIELKNQADNLVYSTEKQLKDFDEKLDADTKDRITKAKDRLSDAVKNNAADVRPAMDALNQLWSEASTKMYQDAGASGSTAGDAAGAGSGSAGSGSGGDGKVEDADYTIVDEEK